MRYGALEAAEAQLDQQTDVWALGVILTWIVTALEPFAWETMGGQGGGWLGSGIGGCWGLGGGVTLGHSAPPRSSKVWRAIFYNIFIVEEQVCSNNK